MRIVICIVLAFALCMTPSFAKNTKTPLLQGKQIGKFKVIGSVKDAMLMKLFAQEVKYQSGKPYRMLNKKGLAPAKAVVLDAGTVKTCDIKKNAEIKEAIRESKPIVMANPTGEKVKAITGVAVPKSDAVLTAPKNGGNAFDISLMNPKSNLKTPGVVFTDQQKVKFIQTAIETKDDEEEDTPEPFSKCHKRWTVIQPYQWGDQGQFLHVGLQYDLYLVTKPSPARKYLIVKTVGKGVSAGQLRYNNSKHRGFYQKAVSVELSQKPDISPPLQLEAMAPATVNQEASSMIAVSTGLQISPILTPDAGSPFSLQIMKTKEASTAYRNFSVSVDSKFQSEKWTYWLSSSNDGFFLGRHKTAHALVGCILGLNCKVRPLPQLASGSVLMPKLEAVYFTNVDEKATKTFVGTITQELEDVKTGPIKEMIKVKRIFKSIELTIAIDFCNVCPPPDNKKEKSKMTRPTK